MLTHELLNLENQRIIGKFTAYLLLRGFVLKHFYYSGDEEFIVQHFTFISRDKNFDKFITETSKVIMISQNYHEMMLDGAVVMVVSLFVGGHLMFVDYR